MTLVLIGLVGGIITGLSPCVLPVLPVVLLGSGSADPDAGPDAEPDPALARRRPYLVVLGLTLSFAVFTLFGSLILGFAVGTAIPLLAFALAGRGMTRRLGTFRRHQGAFRAVSGAVVTVLAVALTDSRSSACTRPSTPSSTTSRTSKAAGPAWATPAPSAGTSTGSSRTPLAGRAAPGRELHLDHPERTHLHHRTHRIPHLARQPAARSRSRAAPRLGRRSDDRAWPRPTGTG